MNEVRLGILQRDTKEEEMDKGRSERYEAHSLCSSGQSEMYIRVVFGKYYLAMLIASAFVKMRSHKIRDNTKCAISTQPCLNV